MSVEVRNLCVSYYGDVEILHDLSLRAEEGKITCIIGPNGAGKSTLLKTICGLLRPTRGKIFLNEEDITNMPAHKVLKKGIFFVPQDRSVFPYLTVEENLKLAGWSIRKDKNLIERRVGEIYEMFPNLNKKKRSGAGFLSGGEMRMLEVTKALVVDPKITMIDEPTAGLAPKYFDLVYNHLKKMREDRKTTIILVDQNIKEGIDVADYVYVLEMGKKQVECPAEELKGERIKEVIKGWFTV